MLWGERVGESQSEPVLQRLSLSDSSRPPGLGNLTYTRSDQCYARAAGRFGLVTEYFCFTRVGEHVFKRMPCILSRILILLCDLIHSEDALSL